MVRSGKGIAMTGGYGTPAQRYKNFSAIYDDLFPFDEDAQSAVSFLEKLAPRGRVLELAAGTGRIAIPLAEQGCDVTGLDASPEMLGVLASRDPDGKVRAIRSDMAFPGISEEFDLIYVVANSLFELHTQELQIACLTSAAKLLRGGGRLVVEAASPSRVFAAEPAVSVGSSGGLDTASFQVMRYDAVRQIVEYRHVVIRAGSITVMPSVHRFIYPSELDLMAALAGLTLAARYGDWTGGPFGAASPRHVSVYANGAR
jgi:SAM-dependent methyltransferase